MRCYSSANIPEEEKSLKLKQQEQHLFAATSQRSSYQKDCMKAKQAAEEGSPPQFSHYSFDFAQQVSLTKCIRVVIYTIITSLQVMYPSDPMQPGPIYFLVPRRCALFGIHAEATNQQKNYMIDEGVSCGKGANVVISLLHHFFDTFGAGESHVSLNCDNCSGQNKNHAMMFYLMWRVLTGRHKSVSLNFMLAGHTKFSVDWGFGLLKRKFRRTKVDCLEDLAVVIEQSSTVNTSVCVGNENGDVHVPTYDWTSFLAPHFSKIAGILSFHHFSFSSDQPGVIELKKLNTSLAERLNILKNECPEGFPALIHPKGLSKERQQYLFHSIRPFVEPKYRDRVCPEPRGTEHHSSPAPEPQEPPKQAAKRGRGAKKAADPAVPPSPQPARKRRAKKAGGGSPKPSSQSTCGGSKKGRAGARGKAK